MRIVKQTLKILYEDLLEAVTKYSAIPIVAAGNIASLMFLEQVLSTHTQLQVPEIAFMLFLGLAANAFINWWIYEAVLRARKVIKKENTLLMESIKDPK